MASPLAWTGFGQWSFLGAAFCCILLSVWLADRRRRGWDGSRAQIAALIASAAWALLVAATDPRAAPTQIAETLRDLGWLAVVYTLFARDGRHESVRPVRAVIASLAFVALLQPALLVMQLRIASLPGADALIYQMSCLFRLLGVTGALVLVHNLYAGAMAQQRAAVRWACAALAVQWGYDLNYFTVAYLADGTSAELDALRGVAQVWAVLLLAVGAVRGQSSLRFSPSRAVAFQTLSLLVIGIYLVVMVAAAQSVTLLGGGATQLVQLGFAFGSTVLVLALVPSGRLRRWLKVMVVKHFFQHRYDYRAEWQRFTRTIGRGGADAPPLHERVVQAVADITDSPAGLLLTPGEGGELVLAARWQWPALAVPACGLDVSAVSFFEQQGFIVDLDELRGGTDHCGETAQIPAWLVDEPAAWALVPLVHFDRLVGLVVLGRPPLARKLDWEDFDLLRVVGQQLASYIAEQNGQVALLEASRFDEFNRRIAFLMHDIKNLASQLSLLSRNAERHADNPDFRADMLVTLRNSSDKLNGLLSRLSRYGGAVAVERLEPVDAARVIAQVAARNAGRSNPVHITDDRPCMVLAHRETLEQVLLHLVQNAVDASGDGAAIFLQTRRDGIHGIIEVIDSGCGMSAEFVRNRLFKPFVSTKPGGFGIGAFEARELVRAMRGRIEVESREGLGTRFVVRLALAATAGLLGAEEAELPSMLGNDDKKVA